MESLKDGVKCEIVVQVQTKKEAKRELEIPVGHGTEPDKTKANQSNICATSPPKFSSFWL